MQHYAPLFNIQHQHQHQHPIDFLDTTMCHISEQFNVDNNYALKEQQYSVNIFKEKLHNAWVLEQRSTIEHMPIPPNVRIASPPPGISEVDVLTKTARGGCKNCLFFSRIWEQEGVDTIVLRTVAS